MKRLAMRMVLGLLLLPQVQASEMDHARDVCLSSVEQAIRQIRDGDLAAARTATAELSSCQGFGGVTDRLRRIIDVRSSEAARQLHSAQVDLDAHDIIHAERRMTAACALDRGCASTQAYGAVVVAQERLEPALERLDQCRKRRSASCLEGALERVRSLDRFNATALEVELGATDWLPAPAGSPSPTGAVGGGK